MIMSIKVKDCKHCKHCLVKKGLSSKVYFCKKQEQKTGVLVSKCAKVKPTDTCKEWEYFLKSTEEK